MRAKYINEFERGVDPKKTLGIGENLFIELLKSVLEKPEDIDDIIDDIESGMTVKELINAEQDIFGETLIQEFPEVLNFVTFNTYPDEYGEIDYEELDDKIHKRSTLFHIYDDSDFAERVFYNPNIKIGFSILPDSVYTPGSLVYFFEKFYMRN
jgi:hypothetical protein